MWSTLAIWWSWPNCFVSVDSFSSKSPSFFSNCLMYKKRSIYLQWSPSLYWTFRLNSEKNKWEKSWLGTSDGLQIIYSEHGRDRLKRTTKDLRGRKLSFLRSTSTQFKTKSNHRNCQVKQLERFHLFVGFSQKQIRPFTLSTYPPCFAGPLWLGYWASSTFFGFPTIFQNREKVK